MQNNLYLKLLSVLPLFLFLSCENPEVKTPIENNSPVSFNTPRSIEEEHKDLHHQLEMATSLPGKTGAYAKEVAHLLHGHFMKEEKFALPPLSLLPDLARGKISSEMKSIIPLSDTLRKDWSVMLKEHEQIKEKLDLLQEAATSEGQQEVVEFTQELRSHALNEEEILYPTAILIGDYLKIKLAE